MKRINEKVIGLIKDRLDAGAKKYGEEILISDNRDFVVETLEELPTTEEISKIVMLTN